uniref:Uncharacterized protein n=1 Tax=Tanacetum cinerariifolium TaxID=118510 RepID=A0A699SF41_TANCI|nr:hypothetical protein [Tanacetum cinerariifolium]
MEMTVAGGPAVGMEPLPVGTSIPPARNVVASMEVKTLSISSESLLILSAAASPSWILLPLIGAASPNYVAATSSLSSNTLTLSFNLTISSS